MTSSLGNSWNTCFLFLCYCKLRKGNIPSSWQAKGFLYHGEVCSRDPARTFNLIVQVGRQKRLKRKKKKIKIEWKENQPGAWSDGIGASLHSLTEKIWPSSDRQIYVSELEKVKMSLAYVQLSFDNLGPANAILDFVTYGTFQRN